MIFEDIVRNSDNVDNYIKELHELIFYEKKALGPKAIPKLLGMYNKTHSSETKEKIIELLSTVPDLYDWAVPAVEFLAEVARTEKESDLREAAARGLAGYQCWEEIIDAVVNHDLFTPEVLRLLAEKVDRAEERTAIIEKIENAFLSLLQSESRERRFWAAFYFPRLPETADFLISALEAEKDEKIKLRLAMAAFDAMDNNDEIPPEFPEIILEALVSTDPDALRRLKRASGQIRQGGQYIIDKIGNLAIKTENREVIELLGHLGAGAIPYLLKIAEGSSRAYICRSATEALASIGFEARWALVRLIFTSFYAGMDAAEWIVKICVEDNDIYAYLVNHINNDDPFVRAAVTRALAVGGKKAIKFLKAALNDQSWPVVCAAIDALGDVKAKSAVPVLRKILSEGMREYKERAIIALAKMGDAFIIPYVRQTRTGEEALQILAYPCDDCDC